MRGGTLGLRKIFSLYYNQGKCIHDPVNANVCLPAGSAGTIESTDLTIWGFGTTATYQLDLWDNQPIVPWMEGGIGVNLFSQFSRQSVTDPGPGSTSDLNDFHKFRRYGFYSVGVKLLLDWLNPRAAKRMDINYGINNVYLMGLFRRIYTDHAGQEFNFAGDMWLVGLNFEL